MTRSWFQDAAGSLPMQGWGRSNGRNAPGWPLPQRLDRQEAGEYARQRLLDALRAVPGVAAADLEPDDRPEGAGTLRLQLAPGADEIAVATSVNRVLREQFGLAVDAGRVQVVEESVPFAPPATCRRGRRATAQRERWRPDAFCQTHPARPTLTAVPGYREPDVDRFGARDTDRDRRTKPSPRS